MHPLLHLNSLDNYVATTKCMLLRLNHLHRFKNGYKSAYHRFQMRELFKKANQAVLVVFVL